VRRGGLKSLLRSGLAPPSIEGGRVCLRGWTITRSSAQESIGKNFPKKNPRKFPCINARKGKVRGLVVVGGDS
jgi:hypothetical protein